MKYLLLIFLLPFITFAQDDDLDKLPYNDTPPQEARPTYFAIAVGYTANFAFLNVKEINDLLASDKFQIDKLNSQITLHGGGGFTGFPIWKNVRLGLFSTSGTRSSEIFSEDNVKKQSNLQLSMSGLHFDYGYVIAKNLALLGGLGLGYGRMELEILQSVGQYEWDDINQIPDAENFNLSLEHKFLFVQPNISIEWAATNFLMIRGNVQYNLTFDNFLSSDAGSWTMNGLTEVMNTPGSLTANNFSAQVGLFIGLFNY